MGGPFNTLAGVGAPTVAKQDRPPSLADLLGNLEGQAQQLKRAAFVTRLARMDWSFEYTDDGRVYRKGVAELAALRLEQLDTDPTAQLWNKHVPEIYRTDRRLKVAIQLASGGYESTWVVSSLPIVDVARHFMTQHDGARVEVSVVTEERGAA